MVGRAIDERLIGEVVEQVLQRLGVAAPAAPAQPARQAPAGRPGEPRLGVFGSVDDAVAAAEQAQRRLAAAPLELRAKAVECVRAVLRRDKQELARLEFAETKVGRLEHKVEKLELAAAVPGVEMLRTEATSGDHGLTVTEFTPFGVVGVVTPVTHSVPTFGCNAIMMLAAGNTLVCNPHPSGARVAAEATRRWNREIAHRTGLEDLICCIADPTFESANTIFVHPGVRLLCSTGGALLARAALRSGKRAIVAGPGNPPVVVDATADVEKAARGIVAGAAYDNNLLCIGEKEVFVVAAVAERLMVAMGKDRGHRLDQAQMDRLTAAVLFRDEQTGHWLPKKEFVGQDAQVLARAIGLEVPAHVRLLFGGVDLQSPLLPCEQMMPLLPILACADVGEAIAHAAHFEHGFRHTAIMWSRDIENLTRMGRALDTTVYVKNGPSPAGLGVGGQGFPSFSIATTGEGVTSPLTFTRYRRCTMVDSLRIG
ncbi:MAG: aldehyde dehydrogenase family protein [Planctomycetes bacterium]|nr:aldehyde dehydrogenase family protein [Planctomycetota bacterium]